jgi:hypothetical protein
MAAKAAALRLVLWSRGSAVAKIAAPRAGGLWLAMGWAGLRAAGELFGNVVGALDDLVVRLGVVAE